jgi:hypothetical protein
MAKNTIKGGYKITKYTLKTPDGKLHKISADNAIMARMKLCRKLGVEVRKNYGAITVVNVRPGLMHRVGGTS